MSYMSHGNYFGLLINTFFVKKYVYINKMKPKITKQKQNKTKKNETRRTVDVAPVISNLYIT